MLVGGKDVGDIAERLGGNAAVLLRQEIHRVVDAFEVAAGNQQVARGFRAAGQRQRVILIEQLARIDRAAERRHGRHSGT